VWAAPGKPFVILNYQHSHGLSRASPRPARAGHARQTSAPQDASLPVTARSQLL